MFKQVKESGIFYKARVLKRYMGFVFGLMVLGFTSAALQAAPLTILIDPGHGGRDPGAVSHGVYESRVNLSIAKEVGRKLNAYGYRVAYTRESNIYLSPGQRAAIAKRYERALVISIHCNGSRFSSSRGVETYSCANYGSSSHTLATKIQRRLVKLGLFKNRGVKRGNFAVLREHQHPSALVECGFISNTYDRAKLKSATYQKRIAEAITQGIRDAVLKK